MIVPTPSEKTSNPFRRAMSDEEAYSAPPASFPIPDTHLFTSNADLPTEPPPPSYVGNDSRSETSKVGSSQTTEQLLGEPTSSSLAGPSSPSIPGGSTSSGFYAPTPLDYSTPLMSVPDPKVPHPCFSRHPTEGLPYQNFKPIFLVAQGKSLEKGFPLVSPPSSDRPHPFISHDINEVDWISFLNATSAAASLTEKDIRRSHLPIVSIVPVIGYLSSYGVQQFMKSRKLEVVVKAIDRWNHHFFEPRKVRVVLMKGHAKLSGLGERPIGNLHNPAPSNLPPSMLADVAAESSNGSSSKGKEKSADKLDDILRLFIVPISS